VNSLERHDFVYFNPILILPILTVISIHLLLASYWPTTYKSIQETRA